MDWLTPAKALTVILAIAFAGAVVLIAWRRQAKAAAIRRGDISKLRVPCEVEEDNVEAAELTTGIIDTIAQRIREEEDRRVLASVPNSARVTDDRIIAQMMDRRQSILIVLSDVTQDVNQAVQLNQRVYYPATDTWRQCVQIAFDPANADGTPGQRTPMLLDYNPGPRDLDQLAAGNNTECPARQVGDRGLGVAVMASLPTNAQAGDTVFLTTDNSLHRYDGSAWLSFALGGFSIGVEGSDIPVRTIIAEGSITSSKIAGTPVRAMIVPDASLGRRHMRRQVR